MVKEYISNRNELLYMYNWFVILMLYYFCVCIYVLFNINVFNINVLNIDKEIEKEVNVKKYEEKYIEEFKNLKDKEIEKEVLENLKNNYILEYTPLGNVMMSYDIERETYIYYSDNSIPYKYLEVVARGYVIKNDCKCLFVDIEEELEKSKKKIEEKLEKEKIEKEQLEKYKLENNGCNQEEKRDVFVKFKSYNKNNTKTIVSIPDKKNTGSTKKQEDNNIYILKEKANRYTCVGRFSGCNILKKIDKKIVNSRLKMNYSDFKKMV